MTQPGEGTFTYDWGKTVNLMAIPEAGATFVKWTGDVDTIADVHAAHTTITAYGNFSVTANFTAGITVTLKQGFNLIAMPVDYTTQPDLRDWLPLWGDSSTIDKILAYDDHADSFVTLLPDDPANPSFILQGGEGLIVYAAQDTTITLPTAACPSWKLKAGLNIVGSACIPADMTAFTLLVAIGDETVVSSVQRFNPDIGHFETAAYHNGQPVGVDFPITDGEGYIIHMKRDVIGFQP